MPYSAMQVTSARMKARIWFSVSAETNCPTARYAAPRSSAPT
jgi:hypothetical protein